MRGTRLAGALLSLASLLQVALALRIAAFNIRTFGEAKMSNATLSNYIVQVTSGVGTRGQQSVLRAATGGFRPELWSQSLSRGTGLSCAVEAPQEAAALLWSPPQIVNRYDIALIQEVRDSHLTAVGSLLDKLNQWVTAVGSQGYWCRQEPTCEWPKIPSGICFNPGMTPTPSITWSASRWDAAPTRSATCSCSGVGCAQGLGLGAETRRLLSKQQPVGLVEMGRCPHPQVNHALPGLQTSPGVRARQLPV